MLGRDISLLTGFVEQVWGLDPVLFDLYNLSSSIGSFPVEVIYQPVQLDDFTVANIDTEMTILSNFVFHPPALNPKTVAFAVVTEVDN